MARRLLKQLFGVHAAIVQFSSVSVLCPSLVSPSPCRLSPVRISIFKKFQIKFDYSIQLLFFVSVCASVPLWGEMNHLIFGFPPSVARLRPNCNTLLCCCCLLLAAARDRLSLSVSVTLYQQLISLESLSHTALLGGGKRWRGSSHLSTDSSHLLPRTPSTQLKVSPVHAGSGARPSERDNSDNHSRLTTLQFLLYRSRNEASNLPECR